MPASTRRSADEHRTLNEELAIAYARSLETIYDEHRRAAVLNGLGEWTPPPPPCQDDDTGYCVPSETPRPRSLAGRLADLLIGVVALIILSALAITLVSLLTTY